MRKRLLAILLAMTMCFSLLPVSALAEETDLDDPPAEAAAGGTEEGGIAAVAEGDGEADDPPAAGSHVVINQAYGGGGNSGAEYKNDFIELYNPTDEDVSLNGWSIQFVSAKNNNYSAQPLSGTIKAKGFYLIQEAAGTGGTKDLPAPDATGTFAMGAKSFKVALVSNTTAISGKDNDDVVDFVGASSDATEYEGSGPAPAPSNTNAVCRKTDGVDTNDNANDFVAQSPNPRNSSGNSAPSITYTLTVKKGETELTAKDNTYTVQLAQGEDSAVLVISGKAGDDTASVTVKKGNTAVEPADGSYTLVAGDYTVSIEGDSKTYTIQIKEYVDTSVVSTIAAARAGSTGDVFTVSGTVTFIDGRNVYVQDGTAGVDVYCKTAPSGISRGDTVVASGTYKVFNGLVELDAAEIISSEAGTLPAPKDITISEIDESVESQLVKITGAKVTVIDGTTVTLSQGEGDAAKTTTIYRCPTVANLTVGDTITVTAVVSRYNAFQLRVNSAADVVITDDTQPEPEQPDEPGDELYKPANGDKVAIYYPGGKQVLTGEASGTRLKGAEVPVSGGVLYTGDALILTASVDSDGYYTFTAADGRVLNTGATGGNMTLVAAAVAVCGKWEVTASAKGDGWLIRSTQAEYSGNKNQYVEYYSGFTTYSLKDGADQGIYTMLFYPESSVKTIDWTVDTEVEQTIAQWGGGSRYEDSALSVNGDLLAVGDMLDSKAVFTAVKNGAPVKPFTTGTSSGSSTVSNWYMGGTSIGATSNDYLQLAASSKGWGGMKLSFRLRATNAGAGSWTLQYSTNGTDFADFTTGSYSASYTSYPQGVATPVTLDGTISDGVAKTSLAAGNYVSFAFDVPVGAENAENLYIRLVPGSDRADGGSGAVSGTVRIDTVKLTGSPVVSDAVTGYVDIDPESDEDVGSGAEIKLTGPTGATVHYGWANNETGEVTYTEGNIATVPDTLPATLFTYASSSGKADSVIRKMTYLPAAVASVQMSPNGGGVYLGDGPVEVTLTCATSGAAIMYNLSTWDKDDGNPKYEKYIPGTTRITLADGFGSLTVSAYAVLDGFSDSAVTTRTFTQRAGEKYKLFFGQMHSHTSYSDGAGTAAEAFNSVKALDQEKWNMDFLSVTDHSNSFDDAGGSKKLADAPSGSEWNEGKALASGVTDSSFVGIFGYEMTWSNGLGHINTFNTPGYQDRTQDAYKNYSDALQNYYAELKTVPTSISQFNHPGTTFGDFSDFAHYDEEIDKLITLIEVGNGEGAIGSSGYFPSYEYYTRALDKGWHVAPTNNQDNHKGGWGTSNTGRDVVLVDELSESAIYDAMRNYRVYATEDLNLEIYYTFDGQIMGSILDADGYAGKAATISVALNDPNNEKATTVQVIVNGGKVLTQKENVTCNETVTFEIENPADYAYYYIKIVQGDGDIAVTAPVWVGAVEAVGITSLKAENALTVVGEEQTFNLELFNNEKTNLEVTSIVFTNKATGKVLHTAADVTRVPRTGTASTSFKASFDTDGVVTVLATVKGTLKDVEKTYTQELELNVMPKNLVKRVVVDGSHYNDYVTGYYGGNMGNMTTIAAGVGVEVVIAKEITAELLSNCELLVVSAPARKSDSANAGPYVPSTFEDSFIDLVKNYVAGGGSVAVCGLADYQDNGKENPDYQISVQTNKLLAAIGSTMRINDDEVIDSEHNGGQPFRLYPENFNMDSKWCKGIVTAASVQSGESYQTYSQYSGCSVNPGSGTWLVKGFDSTWGADSDRDGTGVLDGKSYSYEFNNRTYTYNAVVDKGDVVFLACEEVGDGTVFAAGGVFLSDFEVKAELDNIWDLPYANRTIFENILSTVREDITITPIADTRKAALNKVFTIEGYVTSGTTNPNTTFFDSIYVQDETGGTDVFPYATTGLAIGTKVRVLGYTDAYQGDRELQVISLEILDAPAKVYEPARLTTAQATDYAAYGGQLVSVSGKVSDIVMAGGRVSQFKLTDSSGKAATVFIDGYITNPSGVNNIHTWLKDGQTVSAVGLLYSHPEGDSDVSVPVLRVRNCDEINVSSQESPSESSSGGGTTNSGTASGGASLPVSTGSDSDNGTVVTETTAVIDSKVDGSAASAAVSAQIAQEIVNQAVRNDSDAVVISPDMGGDVTKTGVSIPASAVAEIAEKTAAEIRVETPVAGVTIPNEGLSELAKAGGEVTVSAERSGNTVEVGIMANGKAVDKVPGGVKVSIPQENCTPGTVAMLVREDGTTEVVRQSVASGDGKSVAVPLDGSAKVVIVDNSVSFGDVPASNWAAGAVAFASSHELMNGTGDGVFDPGVSMTRGMLAKVLHNLDNNPKAASGAAFADVTPGAWYADAVAWAAESEIIVGYSDGRFGSNDPITREQLAVMLYRYVGSPAVKAAALNFTDAGDISGYAETAMAWAVANGILNGKGGGILDPKGAATRAEVAQMMLNFVSSTV